MDRTRILSAVALVFTLGFLVGLGQQASAAGSKQKTVTLEIHGMV